MMAGLKYDFSEEGTQKTEQDGKQRRGASRGEKRTLKVQTKTGRCLAMSKVEVGGRVQNPERDNSFACKERVGRGNLDLISTSIFIGPNTYFIFMISFDAYNS